MKNIEGVKNTLMIPWRNQIVRRNSIKVGITKKMFRAEN